MYLSQETVALLKNFATINQSILIKAGKKVRSMSVMKNVLVEADIDEEFSRDVAIYDLNQFLNCLSLVPGAELKLEESKRKLHVLRLCSTRQKSKKSILLLLVFQRVGRFQRMRKSTML